MKKLLLLLSVCFSFSAIAQNEEQQLRENLKKDGLTEPVINKLIEQRNELMQNGRTVKWTNLRQTPYTNAACSDMGVENGWGAWQGAVGTYTPPPIIFTPVQINAPSFNLTTGIGIDACTPGSSPGSPVIPVVAPGFGNTSIQLGELQTNGSVIEQLTFPLTVTVADTNFVYSYAFVIEDPGHAVSDQPFVSICIYDGVGNPLPCGCFKFTAGSGIPGCYASTCFVNSVSYYKPWTTVGVNLSAYIGQTLTVVLQNADCALSGHFAHSYWDFTCKVLSAGEFCVGEDSVQINAPYESGYTYSWSTGATDSTIIADPQLTDTVSVIIVPPSGCSYNLMYVLNPTIINAGFTAQLTEALLRLQITQQFPMALLLAGTGCFRVELLQ